MYLSLKRTRPIPTTAISNLKIKKIDNFCFEVSYIPISMDKTKAYCNKIINLTFSSTNN